MQASAAAALYGYKYFEVNVRKDEGITEAFETLLNQVYQCRLGIEEKPSI